ncbi:VOC family protein [Gordonia terrae]|uniref:VOC family protein n=1 Tax=Gordonia terrae TaxID=2055 RepID=UPI001EF40AB2|nr:VOC family protein [Gordonia terrae]
MARFAFTKIFVDDLDREASFYVTVFGLTQKARLNFGEGVDGLEEIILTSARGDDSNLILWRYAERATPPAGEATIGFTVTDLDVVVRSVSTNGGSVVQTPKHIPEAKATVAFVADPEGHVLEIVQFD